MLIISCKKRRKNTALAAIAAALVSSAGCASDFDTVRATPPRASVGRELYSLVCDRVGAQALREDITGGSYRAICHFSGPVDAPVYADTVDVAQLTPLTDTAVDTNGQPVTREQQEKNRAHRIARIETMGKRREDLVRAFDAAFPDETIALKDVSNADGPLSCNPMGDGSLQKELASTLSRFTDLYNDRTIPLVTESLAEVMDDVHASPEAQAALARLDARQGYRPGDVAMGVSQPLLSYPRLAELADALLRLIASDADPLNPDARIDPDKPAHGDNREPIAGPASADFQGLLGVLREELRTAKDPAPTPPLAIALDTSIPPRVRLSRPRTNLEIARTLLLSEDPAFVPAGATPKYIVRRDARGVASVPLQDGKVPSPFVDANGDKLPDLDPLGRFLTSTKTTLPTPFFASTVTSGANGSGVSTSGIDGPRDADGRALNARGGAPLYDYLDTKRTFFASLETTLLPMVDAEPAHRHETVLNVAAGLPVLFGNRDAAPTSKRVYAKDPGAKNGKTDAPVTVSYRAFHPESSPVIDLVHALGQILSDPAIDDVLALAQRLADEHPQELARLIGVGLEIKAIADKHPEARIPASSTLWDEMFDILAKMAKAPGVLEDLIAAFGKDQTMPLKDVFSAYLENKDELTYDRNALNGPAFNLTTK
ncbi:MAG: hypothetical protein JWM74_4492, partial [Myxococcaceae bacterium]|nr:hypothetical protein [Myxococcaceae bacterium]